MFKAPRCPNCRREYGGPRAQGGAFQPLVLKCGHTYCKSCLSRSLKHLKHELVCPSCQVSTPMPAGETSLKELPPDFYCLGMAIWMHNKTPDLLAHRVEFQTRSEKETYKGKTLKGGRALCEECDQESATCKCQQCDQEFCEKCWSKLHRNNSKSKNPHQRTQIQISVYGCLEHSNMPKEFYCKDDNSPICAYCGLTGSHKGHAIVPIDQQNVEVQDQLKPAFDTAKGVLKRLYHSKGLLEKAPQKVKQETNPVADSIRASFVSLHGVLQRRETMLLNELENLESTRMVLLDQMTQSVRNNISRLETVMSDVARSLKGTSESTPNLTEMISILTSSAELPCYVIRESGSTQPIKFQAGTDITQHIWTHGALQTQDMLRWHLKSNDELPDDYEEVELLDTILSGSKLFSVSSSGKSEIRSPKPEKDSSSTQPSTKKPPLQETQKRAASQLPGPPNPSRMTLPNKDLVYVVHIKSPARFYVQKKNDRPRLEKMMKALYKLCESEDKKKRIPQPLIVGTRCCCRFTADNQWYRAVVKTLPESLQNGGVIDAEDEDIPKIEVLYIDYGNTEWVPVTRLCKIRPKYEREPDLALCCSLIDIVSTNKDGRWKREASESFQAMVKGEDAILMTTKGQVGNMLYVDLHQQPNNSVKDDMPVSLRDALVFLEHACFISPESVPNMPATVPRKKYLPPDVPRSGDEMVIQVSHITDPWEFSVQELENVEYLEDMMAEVQRAYSKRTGPEWQVLCPHVGSICLAYFDEDKRWYRAQVTKVLGKQEVEVRYVDFGNTATVHYLYLRKITDEFLKLSKLSLPCQLADVAPKDLDEGWSDEAKVLFSQCVSYKATDIKVMDVQDGVVSVLAYQEKDNNRTCLNALLVQKGVADTTGPGSVSAEILRVPSPVQILKRPEPETEQPQSSDATMPALVTDNSSETAEISEGIPPLSSVGIPQTQDTGLSLSEAKGIPLSQAIGTLPSHGASVPSKEATTAVHPSKSPSQPGGVVYPSKSGPVVSSPSSSSSQLSGKYNMYTAVHVSHVESPDCIYVQLATAGKDGLDSLLEAMTLHYKEQGKKETKQKETQEAEKEGEEESKEKEEVKEEETPQWKEGDVCGALLVREGVWCRGKIDCILPDSNVVVLFTDYGNSEVVSVVNIRPLEERFMKEPPFAIKCHLVNIIPAGGTTEWTKTACNFLEEKLNDLDCYIIIKGELENGSIPIDLLYELTDKEKLARESIEDLASISELILMQGLALRQRKKSTSPLKKSSTSLSNQTTSKIASLPSTSLPAGTPNTKMPKLADPLTPPSSGVSSLNTTASPNTIEGATALDEGCIAPIDGAMSATAGGIIGGGTSGAVVNGFENFEGSGVEEVLPRYAEQQRPILSQMQIIVTFVSGEGVIHGIELSRFEEFQQMMTCQQNVCNEQQQKSSPPDPSSLVLCQCVCARFTMDDQWYRAQIIGITEDSVIVKYVDFGNTESLPLDRILPMTFLLDVPPFSRQCVLFGLQPKSPHKTWPLDVVNYLLENLVEKTCTVQIKALYVEGEPLKVDLALPTGESMTQVMLSRGLAEAMPNFEDFDTGCLDTASTLTDGTLDDVSVPVYLNGDDVSRGFHHVSSVDVLEGVAEAGLEDSGPTMAVAGQAFTPILFPEPGVEFSVTVPHLCQPDLVYLQYTNMSEEDADPTIALAAQQYVEWDASVTELQNIVYTLPIIINPQPDMPCCAQYSMDKQWYRAEIVEVVRKDIIMCHVKFVDYGTVEWLNLNSIRQLPEKYLNLPMQCRECRVAGIKPPSDLPPEVPRQPDTDWPAKTIKRMLQIVTGKILVACVEETGPIPLVSLYENNEERTPVCAALIEEGLAARFNHAEVKLLEAAAREIQSLIGIGPGEEAETEDVGCEPVEEERTPAAATLEE